ncbi:MAG: ribonuclease HII [bacterium]
MIKNPTFDYEKQYWDEGVKLIAGVDEVGMGALAGPVAAAAVVFNRDVKIQTATVAIRDSKQLSEKQRVKAAKWIKENAAAWAVGEASIEEITELNILRASHLAMQRAVKGLPVQPDLLLIDGRPAKINTVMPRINIIKGDSLSLSIAAASIMAKVYRDGLMIELDKKYPAYGFASHKGYGSLTHRMALKKYGAVPCHRPTYEPVLQVLDRG